MPAYIMPQDEIRHHGVPNQKWGVRRYQNYDGSLKNGVYSTSDHEGHNVKKSNEQSVKEAKKQYHIEKVEAKAKYKKQKQEAYDNLIEDLKPVSDKYNQEVSKNKESFKANKISKKQYKNNLKDINKRDVERVKPVMEKYDKTLAENKDEYKANKKLSKEQYKNIIKEALK